MTTAKARHAFALRLAAGIAGYCAFINLYSPQSILPLLSEEFGASAAGISTIITVSTLAVALTDQGPRPGHLVVDAPIP